MTLGEGPMTPAQLTNVVSDPYFSTTAVVTCSISGSVLTSSGQKVASP